MAVLLLLLSDIRICPLLLHFLPHSPHFLGFGEEAFPTAIVPLLSFESLPAIMGNDAALRTSLLWLALLMLMVGLFTHSLQKVIVTYVFGVLAIAAILLPDWDYFDRHFSRWPHPVTDQERASLLPHQSGFMRFARSPVRLIAYTAIYAYALCKWWEYVSKR